MSESAGDAGPDGDSGADDAYGGVLGAFPYAYRASESRLFRTYVVAGGALAAVVVVLFVLSLVDLIGATATAQGGTFTFARAFVVVVMVAVVGPVLAPVLLVARRHRRAGSTVAYDRAVAAGGYLFFLALYAGLVASAPPALRAEPAGPFAPVTAALYALPRAAGVVPPLAAAGLIYLLHRRFR